jgi:hypothetical protein
VGQRTPATPHPAQAAAPHPALAAAPHLGCWRSCHCCPPHQTQAPHTLAEGQPGTAPPAADKSALALPGVAAVAGGPRSWAQQPHPAAPGPAAQPPGRPAPAAPRPRG